MSLPDFSSINASLWLLGIYLGVLLLALVWRGKSLSSPWLFLLRGFFPNWRFYHVPGNQPRLFVRAMSSTGQWSDWSMFMPRAKFQVIDLFHNPLNNLRLVEQNLIDHLNADVHALPDGQDLSSLVSFALTERLAWWYALQLVPQGEPAAYQFELRVLPALVDPVQEVTIIKTPVMNRPTHAN